MIERDAPPFQAFLSQRALSRRSFARVVGAGAGFALVGGLVAACSGGTRSPAATAGSKSAPTMAPGSAGVVTPATIAASPTATPASATAPSPELNKTPNATPGTTSPMNTDPYTTSVWDYKADAIDFTNAIGPADIAQIEGDSTY